MRSDDVKGECAQEAGGYIEVQGEAKRGKFWRWRWVWRGVLSLFLELLMDPNLTGWMEEWVLEMKYQEAENEQR